MDDRAVPGAACGRSTSRNPRPGGPAFLAPLLRICGTLPTPGLDARDLAPAATGGHGMGIYTVAAVIVLVAAVVAVVALVLTLVLLPVVLRTAKSPTRPAP